MPQCALANPKSHSLSSPKNHHFTGSNEFPDSTFLLDQFKSPASYCGQVLSARVPSSRHSPGAVHSRKFWRDEANLFDCCALLPGAAFSHLKEKALNLTSTFGQFAVNSNVISILVPEISKHAHIPPVKPTNCLIHHASNRPFILLLRRPAWITPRQTENPSSATQHQVLILPSYYSKLPRIAIMLPIESLQQVGS